MSESLLETGGNPAPTPTPSPEGTPAAAPVANINLPDNWRDALPEDIKGDPSLGAIKDIQSLAKSYVHAQKMVGKDKIVVPDQHATDEDWKGVFKKLGLPEAPDKYTVKAEGFEEGFVKDFTQAAYNMNLLPKQAENILGFYKEFAGKSIEAQQAQIQARQQEEIGSLKKEWGSAFDKNLAIAKGALDQFADEDTKKYIIESGLGNDTKLVKLLKTIGEKMGEDQFVGEAKKQAGLTPAEAKEKVNTIMGNREHPYWSKSHPNHKNAVSEVFKLHEYIAEMEKVQKPS